MSLNDLSLEEKRELLAALEEKERRVKENKLFQMFPEEGEHSRFKYPKQLEFFKAGKDYKERAFIAANRVGKTEGGAYEISLHATGLYPDWWEGRRFTEPCNIWCAGVNNEATRDIIQEKLIRSKINPGLGMLPKSTISRVTTRPGVPDAVQDIYVKHVSGGHSLITLKSFEQGREKFQGTSQHVVWLDEEPEDRGIYSECLTRTLTTQGIILCTFTPLKGLFNIAPMFLVDSTFPKDGIVSASKYVVNATWDDVPHLIEADKQHLLQSYSPHERAARSKGLPLLGSGVVYPLNESDICVEPFKIPEHWARVYGFDPAAVGVAAALWGAVDPDTETMYLYSEHYRKEAEPAIHAQAIKARGNWIPGIIDPAGNQNGQTRWELYTDLGLTLYRANKDVDAGVETTWQYLSTGQMKVFSHLTNFLSEIRVYCRDDNGKIVKKHDHLMDCMRYMAIMGFDVAEARE